MFKVYGRPISGIWVSKLFLNFPVVNTTSEAVHVQFLPRKLVFTIIPIAREGSINPSLLSTFNHFCPDFFEGRVYVRVNVWVFSDLSI